MGGIKNKLSKLSNKVKNLLTNNQFLPLDRSSVSGTASRSTSGQPEVRRSEGGRRSLPDEVTKAEGFCFNKSNPQSSCGRQLTLRKGALIPPFRKRRQMKSGRISIGGFDRVVKYTGLACLSIAILSTITLNIISTYSSSNINSNAEQVGEVSTLANIDPASISISISSHSATGDTNDGNLSLSIPQGGGLVAGRHTVSINAGNEIASYRTFLNGGTNENGVDNTDLVNTMADSLPSTGSLATSIPSMAWNSNGFGQPSTFPMYGNGWGVALPDSYTGEYHDKERYEALIATPATIASGAANYLFSGIPPLAYGQDNSNSDKLEGNKIIVSDSDVVSTTDIYYGVKVGLHNQCSLYSHC